MEESSSCSGLDAAHQSQTVTFTDVIGLLICLLRRPLFIYMSQFRLMVYNKVLSSIFQTAYV